MASTSYGYGSGLQGMPPIPGSYLPRAYDTGAISPTQVSANTTGEQTFTVTGLNVGDAVIVNKPTAQAGLGIVGARVSAANTLAINFGNFTGVGITPTASETYKVIAFKCA